MAARLPYLDREQVPPDVQAVYDTMKKATGRVLNTFRLMAHHARSVAPVVALSGALREGDSRLAEKLKKQLGPDALVQLTLSIAAANFTNRFNEALGTELET